MALVLALLVLFTVAFAHLFSSVSFVVGLLLGFLGGIGVLILLWFMWLFHESTVCDRPPFG